MYRIDFDNVGSAPPTKGVLDRSSCHSNIESPRRPLEVHSVNKAKWSRDKHH